MEKKLDPILHNELRLAVMALLISLKEANFPYLKEQTGASSGNLSVQLNKLSEVGYLTIEKGYRDNYPETKCIITDKGVQAFEKYVDTLKSYLGGAI